MPFRPEPSDVGFDLLVQGDRVIDLLGGTPTHQKSRSPTHIQRKLSTFAKTIAEYMKDFQGSSDEGWVAKTEAAKKAEAECMRKVTP